MFFNVKLLKPLYSVIQLCIMKPSTKEAPMARRDSQAKYAIYTDANYTKPNLKARIKVLQAIIDDMFKGVESIPDEVACKFPVMTGIDRDNADVVLSQTTSNKSKPELSKIALETQSIAEGILDYILDVPDIDFSSNEIFFTKDEIKTLISIVEVF